MPNIVSTISVAQASVRNREMELTVDVRLQSDDPADPPRRTFVVHVPLSATAQTIGSAIGAEAQREFDKYKEAQRLKSLEEEIGAVAAAFVGQTFNHTVT
jgi:hypothetical protein